MSYLGIILFIRTHAGGADGVAEPEETTDDVLTSATAEAETDSHPSQSKGCISYIFVAISLHLDRSFRTLISSSKRP
jgi:hypothetical protein